MAAHRGQVTRVKVKAMGTVTPTPKVRARLMPLCATSGTRAPALTGPSANGGMFVGPVQRQVSPERTTNPSTVATRVSKVRSRASFDPVNLPHFRGNVKWSTADYIAAHNTIKDSGKYNFEGARIPIPTSIRYDRLRESLGDNITPKELRTLELLEFGMPVGCNPNFGEKALRKNHHSAVCFKDAIDQYLTNASQSQAILGPFEQSPIAGLCFSPLMTVPKEESKRRVIVDFSFPSNNDISLIN